MNLSRLMKVSSAVFGALICTMTLGACTKNYNSGVMYIEDSGNMTANDLYLLAAIQKQTYADIVDMYANGDWNTVAVAETGKTFSDIVGTVTVESAKTSLICEYLHDHVYELKLDDEKKTQIDRQIDAHIAECGSKTALSEALSVYSADVDTLRRYYTLSYKQLGLYDCLYGDNGIIDLEDDAKAYFADNFSIVTHIYFNLGYKLKSDGSKVSLTDEELAEKRAKAESVYSAVLSGEDFYDLRKQYSEDDYESAYFPNGFFVSAETDFPTEFKRAALDMKVGEVRMVECNDETDVGIHVILKLPMDESLYNSNETVYQSLLGTAVAADIDALMEQYENIVVTDEAAIEGFDVSLIPPFALTGQTGV